MVIAKKYSEKDNIEIFKIFSNICKKIIKNTEGELSNNRNERSVP